MDAAAFDPKCILDMIILSQLLEPYRYTILHHTSEEIIDMPITHEILRSTLTASEGAEVVAKLDEVLEGVLVEHMNRMGVSMAHLLAFDLDGYPMVSAGSFSELRLLSRKSVVCRSEVERVLATDPHFASEPDMLKQNVDSFFKFGSDMITGNCLHEILRKLDREANKIRFSRKYLSDMVSIQRTMATFIPYFIAVITMIVLLNQVDLWDKFTMIETAAISSVHWPTYCNGGVTGECFTHFRTIWDIDTPTELSEFIKEIFVENMWLYVPGSSDSVASTMFHGMWFVGALLVRFSPTTSYAPGPADPVMKFSCSALNLSSSELEYRLSRFFDCQSWDARVIPTSATKDEALLAMKDFRLTPYVFDDAAVIIQYAMLNPATGAVAWVTTMFSLPKYGGVVPRVLVEVLDPILINQVIFPCMIMSIVLSFLDLLVWFMFRSVPIRGKLVFYITCRAIMLGLSIASYVLGTWALAEAENFNLMQTDHIVPGLDAAVNYADISQYVFGLWIFAFFVVFTQYLAHIHGLHVVVKLVQVLIPDILGLFAVFSIVYIMFVMIAMMLFGSTEIDYSNFYTANRNLIQYMILHFDLDALSKNYPRSGFAFYYVFRVFITYIMLNFFIVTIIAPIRMVWLEGDLPIVLSEVLAGTKTTIADSVVFHFRSVGMILCDIIFNSLPRNVTHYINFYQITERLYSPETPLIKRLEAAAALLEIRQKPNVKALRTERARTIQTTSVACNDASYFLCRLSILTESNLDLLRDARMQTLLVTFDEFGTKFERDFRIPADETEFVYPPTDIAAKSFNAKRTDGYEFHFTRYMLDRLRRHNYPSDTIYVLWTLLESIAILALYVVLAAVVIGTPRSVAFMTHNVHGALRDLHLRQNCDDANCTSGFLRKWTYEDNKFLSHLNDYGDRLLYRQLFPLNGSHDFPPHNPHLNTTVNWDPFLVVQLPVTVRQLRAHRTDCTVLNSAARTVYTLADAARLSSIKSQHCGAGAVYSSNSMTIPPDTLLDASAYSHFTSCTEMSDEARYGDHIQNYPCGGYMANIMNTSQLKYAVEHYLDSDTRYMSITIRLQNSIDPRGSFFLEYQLLAEFSHGGSAASFWTNSRVSRDPDMDTIASVELVIMSIDFALAIIGICIRTATSITKYGRVPSHTDGANLRILSYFVFLSFYQWLSTEHWSKNYASVVCIAFITMRALFAVLFPLAQFFFRRTTTISDFLRLSALKVYYIIPILLIILVSFSLAGYAMWGGTIDEFSSLHRSFYTISQSFLGDFDMQQMNARNQSFAMLFTVLLTIGVIIFALNLLLAIIAGCADESRERTLIFQPIVTVAAFLGRKVYYGPLMRVVVLFLMDHFHQHEMRPAAVGSIRKHRSKMSFTRPCMDSSLRQSFRKSKQSFRKNPNPLAVDKAVNEDSGLILEIPRQFSGSNVTMECLDYSATHSAVKSNSDDGREAKRTTSEAFQEAAVGSEEGVDDVSSSSSDDSADEPASSIFLALPPDSENLHRKFSEVGLTAFEELTLSEKCWQLLLAVLFGFKHNVARTHMQSGEDERLPLPIECLSPHIGPFIVHELSIVMRLHLQPQTLVCALVAFLLQEHASFKYEYPGEYAEDKDKDAQLRQEARDVLAQERRDAEVTVRRKAPICMIGIQGVSSAISDSNTLSPAHSAGFSGPKNGLLNSSHQPALNAASRTSIRAMDLASSFRYAKKMGKIARLPEGMQLE